MTTYIKKSCLWDNGIIRLVPGTMFTMWKISIYVINSCSIGVRSFIFEYFVPNQLISFIEVIRWNSSLAWTSWISKMLAKFSFLLKIMYFSWSDFFISSTIHCRCSGRTKTNLINRAIVNCKVLKVISLSINSSMELIGSSYEVLIIVSKSKASANQVRNIPQITQNLNTSVMLRVRRFEMLIKTEYKDGVNTVQDLIDRDMSLGK